MGRFFSVPVADSSGTYVVTAEVGRTAVRIEYVPEVSFGYMRPDWGEKAIIRRSIVERALMRRDSALFAFRPV